MYLEFETLKVVWHDNEEEARKYYPASYEAIILCCDYITPDCIRWTAVPPWLMMRSSVIITGHKHSVARELNGVFYTDPLSSGFNKKVYVLLPEC